MGAPRFIRGVTSREGAWLPWSPWSPLLGSASSSSLRLFLEGTELVACIFRVYPRKGASIYVVSSVMTHKEIPFLRCK